MLAHIQGRNQSPVKYDYRATCIVCFKILIHIVHSIVLGNAMACLCTESYFIIQLITVTPSGRVFPRKLPVTQLTKNSKVFTELGGPLLYFQDPSSFRILSQLNLVHTIKIYTCFELSQEYTVVDVITLCIPIFIRNKQTRFYMAFVFDIYRFQVIQTACVLALLIQLKCFVYCDLSDNK